MNIEEIVKKFIDPKRVLEVEVVCDTETWTTVFIREKGYYGRVIAINKKTGKVIDKGRVKLV